MRYFNLMLNPAEIAAYAADYLEEASPRANAARMLLRIVAMTARMTTELEELKRSENSHSIWKLHADALVVLIDMATRASEAVGRLVLVARQKEIPDKSESLRQSLGKLRERIDQVVRILAQS
jgi:anti-sigma factor ChrR (cupin superfamily)